MLNAQEVTVRFSRHAPPILDRLDFSFAQGSRIAIMGPSGCGKSTLQRVLTGLQPIDGGRITLDDAAQPDARDRAARRGWHRTILMLPQDTARIFNPALRLRSQFRSCLALHGIGDDETDRDRVAVETLQGCDVPAAALDRHADGLSGGQRQRAALARLLCLKPRFLLLDEPTAALDPATARDLLDLVLGLQRHQGFGLLLSTHDTKIARRADLVYNLVDGRLTAQA